MGQHTKEIPSQDVANLPEVQMIQNGRLLVFQSSLVEALAIGEYIKLHSTEAYFVASGTVEMHSELQSRSRKIEEKFTIW